jgi:nucleoside-diphosphate-sugar epimerase
MERERLYYLAFAGMQDFYAGKRVLVTGGAGAIGSNLVKALVFLGSQVVVVDDLSSGYLCNLQSAQGQITWVRGDIAQDRLVAQLGRGRFDLVFHLAAFFANQNSVDHPEQDLATNGLGTLKLCQWALASGVGRFVFASSSCVYGSAAGLISEATPLDPHTPYAMTKVLAEEYLKFYGRRAGLETVILRYFNSFGPGEFPGRYRNVIPNFFAKALHREPLPLLGTGEETRDFTFVVNTIRGTLLAGMVPAAAGEVLNIGTGQETCIVDLAMAINEITGSAAGVVYQERRSWDRVERRCADITRAGAVLGYEPLVGLEEGLHETHRWFLAVGGQAALPRDRALATA